MTLGYEANSKSIGLDISSPLRSVFPISFDCLYSQIDISLDVAGTVDETEGSHDVGSFVDQDVGSFVGQDVTCCEGTGSNVGSDPSSSLRQRRQPKHNRQQQQQQRRSALAPTPIPQRLLLCSKEGRPCPNGPDPTGRLSQVAQVVVPHVVAGRPLPSLRLR